MTSERISDDSPAVLLFPQFESELYETAASEVAGGDLICISTVEVFVEGMSITLDDSRETE